MKINLKNKINAWVNFYLFIESVIHPFWENFGEKLPNQLFFFFK